MQTVMGRQKSRAALIQQVTAYKSHVQKWCLQAFPQDPALAREVAEHALVRLLSRLEEREITNLATWVFLTTWNLCLQRIANAYNADWQKKSKPAAEPTPTELPWLQGIKIINGLDEKQRIMIKLKDLRGFDYAAMARVTGQSVAQVQSQVSDARRNFLIKWDKLRKLGEKTPATPGPELAAEAVEKELRIIFPYMRAQIQDCPSESRLIQFLEGTLTRAEGDTVNRHTRVCGICDLLLNRVVEFERGGGLSESPVEIPATTAKAERSSARPTEAPPAAPTERAVPSAHAISARAAEEKLAPLAQAQGSGAGRADGPSASWDVLPQKPAAGPPAPPRRAEPAQAAKADDAEKIRTAVLRVFEAAPGKPPEIQPTTGPPPAAPAGRSLWGTVGLILIVLLAIIGLYITYGGLQK